MGVEWQEGVVFIGNKTGKTLGFCEWVDGFRCLRVGVALCRLVLKERRIEVVKKSSSTKKSENILSLNPGLSFRGKIEGRNLLLGLPALACTVRDQLPWQVSRLSDFFFQGVMALPYHIYVVSTKIPQNEYTERVQYGTTLVFLLLVALIATASILLRNRLRKKHAW